jgi:sugar O-acyltransferase (sialic acid O-acetyltransferase NeuD family)
MIGAGGHSRVLEEALNDVGYELSGFVAPSAEGSRLSEDVPWIGNDEVLLGVDPNSVLLINGVGSAGNTAGRQAVFENYKKHGFEFLQIVSETANVAESASLVEGVQVLAGAIINTDAFIDDNTIINTGAIVEHHSVIGESCHVATGATICGDVTVGNGTHIGAGATIIQGVTIGAKCIIGAGAVVITDVPDGHTAVGVPAKLRPNKA